MVVAKVISVLTIAAALYLYHPLLSILVLLAPLPTLYSVSLGEKLQFRFVKESTELQRETEYFEELLLSPAEKEQEIQKEQKPSFRHLLRLFLYVFRATKGISCIYLGLFVLLSFLRPLIAEIWGRYISVVENAGNRVTEAALMLGLYWGISFAADLLESYLAPEGGGDFEQLDMVQANRQQELFKVHLLKKVNSVSPEYLEAVSYTHLTPPTKA